MARRSGLIVPARQSSKTSRRPSWAGGPIGAVGMTATGTAIYATGSQSVVDNVTIIRTRGLLEIRLESAATLGDGFRGAVGICVVTENAFNAGIGSIPTPIVDVAWDGWLWYSHFALFNVTGTIADGVNAVTASQRIWIDSKAMRKTRVTDVAVAVIAALETGAASFDSFLDTRMLSKQMS